MHPSTLAKRATVLLFIAIVGFYFFGLGHLPFVGPDEPRYAQVAREMFLRHDLITPTLAGHTWFEKPALLYWMMMLSFKLFGVSEWSARLPSAISGVLTIAAVLVISCRVESVSQSVNKLQGYAFWSATAAATMLGIVIFSRAASFDMVLTMTISWAFAFYMLHAVEENSGNPKPRSALLAGFYIFIGLSLLAKGLVGIVIPCGVLAFYYLFQRRLPERRIVMSTVWGLPLALIVASTWYGPVICRHGWVFIDQFFIQHHFARYVSNKYRHSQPVYFYLMIVPLLALPWTAFLIAVLLKLKSWSGSASSAIRERADKSLNVLMSFALAWFLFPLVFFSFSGSKLPGYILPVLPAAALMIGRQVYALRMNTGKWAIRTTGSIYLLFGIGALVYSGRAGKLPLQFAVMLAALLFVAGVFPFLFKNKPAASVGLMAAVTVFAVILLTQFVAPKFADTESSRRLLQLADARGYAQTPIFGIQRNDRTPEFYAAGRVVYGADGEPIMQESLTEVIEESRKRNEVVLTFVPVRELRWLTDLSSAKAELVGDNGRYALVAVRAQ